MKQSSCDQTSKRFIEEENKIKKEKTNDIKRKIYNGIKLQNTQNKRN